ncbi:MAG: chorismate mutase [Planctomycetes bacterium]|nr:chorismate mutase [Planctomycetota bacterium]
MDRLNARLAADVQARARLALEIAREKAKHGLPAADPVRERDMLRRVLDEAPPGLPRCDLARVFKTLFVASRELVLADRADDAPACPPRRRPTPGPRVGAGRSRGTRVRARPSGETRVSARRSNQ